MTHSILLFEDEPVLAGNIQRYLEIHHYDVEVASTIATGLKIINERQLDVVVLDILLPDGDGREVLRRVREMDRKIGVIVMTAFGSVPLAVDIMTAGADDYVEKPVPLATLKLMIDRLIERKWLPAGSC